MTKIMKIIGITLLVGIVIPLVGMSYSNASEFNSTLKGEYVFSQTQSCASGPFDSDLARIANGITYTVFIQGVLTFNGDGTGISTFTTLQIRHTDILAGQYPVRQSAGSGTLLYNVYEDKTFTVETQAISTSLVGPDPGGVATVSGVEWNGWIGPGKQLLLISDNQPNIEIITLENGNTMERICGRSNTSIRKKLTEETFSD